MKRSIFSEEQIARAATGRVGHSGCGCVPPDRRVGDDVLHVEEEFGNLGVTSSNARGCLTDAVHKQCVVGSSGVSHMLLAK